MHPPTKAVCSVPALRRCCTNGTTIINNPGRSNDDLAAFGYYTKAGEQSYFQILQVLIKINAEGVRPVSPDINCGESGLINNKNVYAHWLH